MQHNIYAHWQIKKNNCSFDKMTFLAILTGLLVKLGCYRNYFMVCLTETKITWTFIPIDPFNSYNNLTFIQGILLLQPISDRVDQPYIQ